MSDDKLKIYEDQYNQSDVKKTPEELMDEDQLQRVQFYLTKYEEGKSAMEERKQE